MGLVDEILDERPSSATELSAPRRAGRDYLVGIENIMVVKKTR